VEHLTDLSQRTGIQDVNIIAKLLKYANIINTENKKYNLTGHKTLTEIIENLIIGSLEPIKSFSVPRGTLFADLGTGAGIPGIPISIKNYDSHGVLFDSNQKKIRFINKTASDLEIKNVQTVDIRVEDAGRSNMYREKFDIVFTRAMSDIYTIAELGSPLLKVGGFIFLYINANQLEYTDYLLNHLSNLGLSAEPAASLFQNKNPLIDGVLLKKNKITDNRYPRRMPVIKRMAMK